MASNRVAHRLRIVFELLAFAAVSLRGGVSSAESQRVEGFAAVEFHHNANGAAPTRDFRGAARGYMTAGWWIPGSARRGAADGPGTVIDALESSQVWTIERETLTTPALDRVRMALAERTLRALQLR